MEEVIAKSKKFKAERQKNAQEDEAAVFKLILSRVKKQCRWSSSTEFDT